jgi:hypothetical protein
MQEEIVTVSPAETKEPWETPQLRVLPVPTKTQGGFYNLNDADDGVFYRVS